MQAINPSLLVPVGKALLFGTFGLSLLQSIRGKSEMAIPFERVTLAMIALGGFEWAAGHLEKMSLELSALLSSKSPTSTDLRALLFDLFKQASEKPSVSGSGPNVPEIMEQAWRTGVWGTMSAVTEGAFLIVSFVLECAHDVLWQLLLFLFPLAAGAYPTLPRLMTNLGIYALELSLWNPMLLLVETVTGQVARDRMGQAGGWGLSIAGIELVAIVLILGIPAFVHRFMSGAFSGDMNSQSTVFVWAQRAIRRVRGPA